MLEGISIPLAPPAESNTRICSVFGAELDPADLLLISESAIKYGKRVTSTISFLLDKMFISQSCFLQSKYTSVRHGIA